MPHLQPMAQPIQTQSRGSSLPVQGTHQGLPAGRAQALARRQTGWGKSHSPGETLTGVSAAMLLLLMLTVAACDRALTCRHAVLAIYTLSPADATTALVLLLTINPTHCSYACCPAGLASLVGGILLLSFGAYRVLNYFSKCRLCLPTVPSHTGLPCMPLMPLPPLLSHTRIFGQPLRSYLPPHAGLASNVPQRSLLTSSSAQAGAHALVFQGSQSPLLI